MNNEDFKDISNPVFLESVNKIIEQKGLCDGINCDFKEGICPFHYTNSKNDDNCSENQYKSYDKESLLNSAIEFKKMLENQNKYFEEIQEKTKEIIKNTDEKLKSFELKEGMKVKNKFGNIHIFLESFGDEYWYENRTCNLKDEIDWEATRRLNEVKEQPKQEKYIIWNPKGCNPKKIHETLKSAEKEAERLALSQPNQDFYVLEVVKKVRGNVIFSWE